MFICFCVHSAYQFRAFARAAKPADLQLTKLMMDRRAATEQGRAGSVSSASVALGGEGSVVEVRLRNRSGILVCL
jgi:hypothetical protein